MRLFLAGLALTLGGCVAYPAGPAITTERRPTTTVRPWWWRRLSVGSTTVTSAVDELMQFQQQSFASLLLL